MLSCYCYMLWFIRVDDGDGTFPRNFDLHSDATEEAICQQQIQEHKEELVNNLPSPSWLTTQFYCTDTFFFFFSSLLLVLTHSLLATDFYDFQTLGNNENGLWNTWESLFCYQNSVFLSRTVSVMDLYPTQNFARIRGLSLFLFQLTFDKYN